MLENYEIDWASIRSEISKLNAKSIFIELPEGLKGAMPEISENLRDYRIYFSGENVYGACDTQDNPFDVTLHFGHSIIPDIDYGKRIIFIELRRRLEISEEKLSRLSSLKFKRIGLVATVQYIGFLPILKDYLERNGKKAIISSGDSRLTYPGQVLGCDFSAAISISDSVDCFIVFADGEFHARGIAISTGKETIALDPNTFEIRTVDHEKFLRQRYAMVEKAMNSRYFGIIVSMKLGQTRYALANILKEKINRAGKRAEIIIMNEITPQKLMNIPVDMFVNTACPRIALDDAELFNYRIITLQELEMALGERPLSDYTIDMINRVDRIKGHR